MLCGRWSSSKIDRLQEIIENYRPHTLTLHCDGVLPNISLTILQYEGFEQVISPESNCASIVSWRDRKLPNLKGKIRNICGETGVSEKIEMDCSYGQIISTKKTSLINGFWAPNGYQNLFVPKFEYFGYISHRVKSVLERLSAELLEAVHRAREEGQQASPIYSHVRFERMSFYDESLLKRYMKSAPNRL